jgi:hypothetical protein
MPIIIVSVFIVCLAAVMLFFTKRKPKATKKEDVVYVYKKEDLK